VFDCPEAEQEKLTRLAKSCMEDAMELSVPLKVETGAGRDWSEAH
jgi:DNA polymerase-1